MRNLNGDQAAEIAYDIVRDHLLDGVDYIAVTETVAAEYPDGEEVQDEDITEVNSLATLLLEKLIEQLENL